MKKYLKIFGYDKEELLPLIDNIFANSPMADYSLETTDLDSLLTIEADYFSDMERAIMACYDSFGMKVYADEIVSLPQRAIDYLRINDSMLSTAESITGGLIASTIIDISGASDVFYSGLVTYSSDAKVGLLGVSKDTIDAFGAVSPDVCYQMAIGLLNDPHVSYGISTTGLASEGGEFSTEKPVGLTYIGIADEVKCEVYKYIFKGDRNEIRRKAVNAALFKLICRIKMPTDFDSLIVQ